MKLLYSFRVKPDSPDSKKMLIKHNNKLLFYIIFKMLVTRNK